MYSRNINEITTCVNSYQAVTVHQREKKYYLTHDSMFVIAAYVLFFPFYSNRGIGALNTISSVELVLLNKINKYKPLNYKMGEFDHVFIICKLIFLVNFRCHTNVVFEMFFTSAVINYSRLKVMKLSIGSLKFWVTYTTYRTLQCVSAYLSILIECE